MNLMQVGGLGEASEYILDCKELWEHDGALSWLETVYCKHKKANVPPLNAQGRRLFSTASAALESSDLSRMRGAINDYQKILDTVDTNDESTKPIRANILRRMGLCHSYLKNQTEAVRHFNSALAMTKPNDTDAIKELYYNRADLKESMGDLIGALKDYQFVFERIGRMSTAHDAIKRIEGKLQHQTSIIAPFANLGVSEEEDEMESISQRIEAALPRMPEFTPVASSMERCSVCQRGGIKLSKCAGCGEGI
mmetsp:Transcript_2565/g.3423  ORF Transcript_2565/g.3423 Transcript_2565/m.3423 type:complete len:252 (+) Transcript_2565:240-995(+)